MFVSSSLRLLVCQLVREPRGLRRPDESTVRLCKTHFQKTALALRRDTLVSVEYSEELNFTTSSATYQRTNRHGILGQKPSDFQRFL
jgi:hypothetical protein